jgi:DNA-binding MarR family transcriptional regulator
MTEAICWQTLERAAKLRTAIDEALRPWELRAASFQVLKAVRAAGEEGTPVTRIGNHLLADGSDLTRLIDRLEARHYLKRYREGKDRRVVTVRLTAEGREVMEAAEQALGRVFAEHGEA